MIAALSSTPAFFVHALAEGGRRRMWSANATVDIQKIELHCKHAGHP